MSHIPLLIWMIHVTRVIESCLSSTNIPMRVIWMSHLSQLWMSRGKHMDELYTFTDMNESCHTGEQVMSLKYEYTYECHMNESCVTYEWVMGRMNDVDESCHTCDWVMSLKYECTYEGQMNDTDESHPFTNMNESCHTCGQVMSLKYRVAKTHRMPHL